MMSWLCRPALLLTCLACSVRPVASEIASSPAISVMYYRGCIGLCIGLYGDNGKENGNYYLGFRVQDLGFRVCDGYVEFQGAGTCNPSMTMMEGRPEGLRIGLYCSLPRIFYVITASD